MSASFGTLKDLKYSNAVNTHKVNNIFKIDPQHDYLLGTAIKS